VVIEDVQAGAVDSGVGPIFWPDTPRVPFSPYRWPSPAHLVTTLVFAENLVLLDIRRLGGPRGRFGDSKVYAGAFRLTSIELPPCCL
jgi:hypothetical protein